MKLLMHEVLQKVSNAKTKAQKVKLLEGYNTPALRAILIANFDESVISMLPDGEVPYKKNEAPEDTEHTKLAHEYRKLYLFFKGGANISQTRRETLFIQLSSLFRLVCKCIYTYTRRIPLRSSSVSTIGLDERNG